MFLGVTHQISMSHRLKNRRFESYLSKILPWSHIACGVFAAAVQRPKFPNCMAALRFLCKPYDDFNVFSSPQDHHKPCVFLNLTLNLFSEIAMPQCRNHTARSSYGGLAMAVRWHTFFTLSWVPIKSCGGPAASLQWPHGALTAAVRQTCGSVNNHECAVRSPYGHLPVSLRSPYVFLFHESYNRRVVAVTFVTTTTIARKTLWFLKFTFYKP